MTINETEQDLRNQRAVMEDVLYWFQSLPAVGNNGVGFTSREIQTVAGESTADYEVWWNHLCVGVIEIKCRMKLYDDWVIARQKMETLYKRYQAKGFPAMIVFAHVVNGLPGKIYLQDLRNLIAEKDKWKVAPPEMMDTTNHGQDKRTTPVEGILLPSSLFWEVS